MESWLLENMVRSMTAKTPVPEWLADAEQDLLEDAGCAIASARPDLVLLDALGDDVDLVAARLLARLN